MNFENFIKELKEEVQNLVGQKYVVSVHCVLKINGERQEMNTSHEEMGLFPAIYLEDYYQEFQQGKSIPYIAGEIVRLSRQGKRDAANIFSDLRIYEQVRPLLRVKLIPYERNNRLLQDIPHEQFLDMAVVPYVIICRENVILTANVRYSFLKEWHVEAGRLLEEAKRNTLALEPAKTEDMESFIFNMLRNNDNFIKDTDNKTNDAVKQTLRQLSGETEMYILTNEKKINGAYAAFQTDVLSALADRLGADKLYLLPSSVHEIIAVPVKGLKPNRLYCVVESVNLTEVPTEDFLSDKVYGYNRLTNQIIVEKR